MKTRRYKTLFLLLIIPFISFSNGPKGKYSETKSIQKKYEVNADALLKINNKFGKVAITTWDENRIEVRVEITVSGNNQENVLTKLDEINIDFQGNKELVSVTTLLKKKSKSWLNFSWFNWGSSNNLSYQINYKVKMPISNDLTVYNDYGTISLNELDGEANINCDFGKILIGSLNNSNNTINIDYTKKSIIEFMEGGKINADFSGFTLDKANKVTLNADYTSSKIGVVKDLKFSCDFGSLHLDKGYRIDGSGDYLSMRFKKIVEEVRINADFGSLKIKNLQPNFELVKLITDYTSITIGLDDDVACNIKINLDYGSLKYDGNKFNFPKKIKKSTSKKYEGYFGNENKNSLIAITADFGSVKLVSN